MILTKVVRKMAPSYLGYLSYNPRIWFRLDIIFTTYLILILCSIHGWEIEQYYGYKLQILLHTGEVVAKRKEKKNVGTETNKFVRI